MIKSFLNFIFEAPDRSKLKHLEHIEDEMINLGIEGAIDAINILSGIGNQLEGNAESNTVFSTKFDGAPAIITGINPENGKFFVATKSAFAKSPKLCYSTKDVKNWYTGDLADKLSLAIELLPELGIKGILQGDFLFSKKDLKTKEIDGETYYIFRPNTITYAVPVNSELGDRVSKSQIGIVFHSTYTGDTIEDLQVSFGADISNLNQSRRVWFIGATFEDATGLTKFSSEENTKFQNQLRMAKGSLKKSGSIIQDLVATDQYSFGYRLKVYFNSRVRDNKKFIDVLSIQKEFEDYYYNFIQKEIEKRKTEKGKEPFVQKIITSKNFFDRNKNNIYMAIATYVTIHNAKNIIINKLNKVNSLKSFLEVTPGEYKVTNPEGFVAITGSKAVKFVDRLNFSAANFNIEKNWD